MLSWLRPLVMGHLSRYIWCVLLISLLGNDPFACYRCGADGFLVEFAGPHSAELLE